LAAPLRISVVVNTLNEESRLAWALGSVRPWADEIIVVDMQSEDRTAEIATAMGAQVFQYPRTGYVEPARAFAVSKATGDWILLLDADEMVPKSTSAALLGIAERGEADVVVVPFRCFFFGREMKGGGWSIVQDHHERFFRPGQMSFTATIHGHNRPVPGARIVQLPPEPQYAFVHFNYVDINQFIDKLNRYTTIEATSESKGNLYWGIAISIKEFLRRYLKLRGYRDGWQGLYLAAGMAFYRLVSVAKRVEGAAGSRGKVEDGYRRVAEEVLSGYGPATSPSPDVITSSPRPGR
jgi:glycosyltransferase involved in cell wall biosynthesis